MLGGQTRIVLPEGTKVPNHIAMILDGNRRWARARGLKPWEGHAAGYRAVKRLARASRSMGVHTFTVWAFSTENWERPRREIEEIMKILRYALKENEKEFHRERVRLVHLGRKDRLPDDIAKYLQKIEGETREYNDNHVFNLAVDYGGRDEILRAVGAALKRGGGRGNGGQIDRKLFESCLDTADQPYPDVDLFIRTSGEQRTSGLMPWQMEYAEFYFENEHLPEFTPEKLKEAVLDFSRRRRRFGADDKQAHLRFDPKLVASLEVKWRHELALGEGDKFRDLVVRYVTEHYGLSKDLAKTAGYYLAKALVHRKHEDFDQAKESLRGLYEILRKSVGLALEPEIVASFEVKLWREANEEDMRWYLAEKFRFSEFQARKSARLACLANQEIERREWGKAEKYLRKFYEALKERVA